MQNNNVMGRLISYSDLLATAVADLPIEAIVKLVEAIDRVRCDGGWVYTMGNGGSSATASHFASDLTKGASNNTKPCIKARCLTDDTPAMTAWANDTHYGNIFAGQMEGCAGKGDIVIGLSVGGNSPNVTYGLKRAKELGALSVAIVGAGGGMAENIADIVIKVPERDTERVEDLHSVVCHSVTCCLRNLA